MSAPAGRDMAEAVSALERLYQKNVVSLEEAQAAMRLVTGDAAAVFPPPRPEPQPEPAPAAAPAPEAPAAEPAAEAPADTSSAEAPPG